MMEFLQKLTEASAGGPVHWHAAYHLGEVGLEEWDQSEISLGSLCVKQQVGLKRSESWSSDWPNKDVDGFPSEWMHSRSEARGWGGDAQTWEAAEQMPKVLW